VRLRGGYRLRFLSNVVFALSFRRKVILLDIARMPLRETEDVADRESIPVIAPVAAHYRTLEEMLRQRALLSDEALHRAMMVHAQSGERLDAVVTRLGLMSEQALADELARATGGRVADAEQFPATPVEGPELSVDFLKHARCIPIALHDDRVTVAVSDPFDDFVAPALAFIFGRTVDRVVARASDIELAIDRLYRGAAPSDDTDAAVDDDDLERLKDIVSDAPVIRAVNRLIARAVDDRASDIHLEPTDDSLCVRLRIDGVLRDIAPLPAAMRGPMVSRIKVMAGLNIAERRLPQDGRMRVAVRGHEIDLRVATAPSIHGESVVMRILDRSKLALDFATLGFAPELTDGLRRLINRPHGILLVTGPTGSGKTTTLYAALAELNSRECKILTVEDPIEYRLPGIVQAQVNPAIDFSFSNALRSFLRQDPDIIMVGEIRDGETAQIAVQAALTGHLILSTLHTNTAAGAVTRLLDMGLEPFLLSSVLTGALAQRLVRRLCASCREPFAPDESLAPVFAEQGVAMPTEIFRSRGCHHCNGSGYTGRIAIVELLTIDSTIAQLVLRRADTREIALAARAAGTPTLLADGLTKVAAGQTTIEEVLRVAAGE